MAANILNKELTAGTITVKGSYYYIVMSWNENVLDENNEAKIRKRTKWLPTKISVKEQGGKTRAKDLLVRVRVTFDRENPNVPISKLLSQDGNAAQVSEPPVSEPEAPKQPEVVADKGILFSDYMLEWLEDYKRNIELTTLSSYQKNVICRIAPYFKEKGIYLNELTAQDIHTFYREMARTGLKTESVIRFHSNIRKALVDAVTYNYQISPNVLAQLKKPKKPDKEIFVPSFYSIDELNEMFKAFRGNRIELVVRLAAFYGFRREEVLGLKWSAIDFKQNTITVSHTVTQCSVDGKSTLVCKDRAKNPSSRRILPLVTDFNEILSKHKNAITENRKLFGREYNKQYNEYVCVDAAGNLIKPGYVTRNFVKVLEAHGLRRIRFHDLRHSCASLLVASGIPMKMIQEWLGHSNFSTTADRYSHLEHTQKMESANALTNIGLKM